MKTAWLESGREINGRLPLQPRCYSKQVLINAVRVVVYCTAAASTYTTFVPLVALLVHSEIEVIHQISGELDSILQGHFHAGSLNLSRYRSHRVAKEERGVADRLNKKEGRKKERVLQVSQSARWLNTACVCVYPPGQSTQQGYCAVNKGIGCLVVFEFDFLGGSSLMRLTLLTPMRKGAIMGYPSSQDPSHAQNPIYFIIFTERKGRVLR